MVAGVGGGMKTKHFYVNLEYGCTIVKATNQTAARKFALAEWGRSGFVNVREATDEDVAWVQAMGGAIHEVS